MRVRRWTAVLAVGALVLTGCSAATEPESVSAIGTALERVDEALADEDLGGARSALDVLTALTEDAHDDGQLDDDAAERVLAAASRLEAQMTAYTTAPQQEQATPARKATSSQRTRRAAPKPKATPKPRAQPKRGTKGKANGKGNNGNGKNKSKGNGNNRNGKGKSKGNGNNGNGNG